MTGLVELALFPVSVWLEGRTIPPDDPCDCVDEFSEDGSTKFVVLELVEDKVPDGTPLEVFESCTLEKPVVDRVPPCMHGEAMLGGELEVRSLDEIEFPEDEEEKLVASDEANTETNEVSVEDDAGPLVPVVLVISLLLLVAEVNPLNGWGVAD